MSPSKQIVTRLWAHLAAGLCLVVVASACYANSWKEHFVKTPADIPRNAFRAYYFNEQQAGILVHSEVVARPAIHTTRDFQSIPTENLGAYWIGQFDFAERENLEFNLIQGHAETKILVNGEPIYQGSDYSRQIPHVFDPGRHKIEVQFVSSYFSVGYMVTLLPAGRFVKHGQLRERIPISADTAIQYCGTYESKNLDGRINVHLKDKETPTVLFLSSYEPVIWDFGDSAPGNLDSVVIFSVHEGAMVVNVPERTDIWYIQNFFWPYKLVSKSDHSAGGRKKSFKDAAYAIQDLLGRKPSGFSGVYGLAEVGIPQIVLTQAKYAEMGMTLHPRDKDAHRGSKSRLDRVFE